MPLGGQCPPTAGTADGNKDEVEEGPEPGEEEHHLRGDEQDHSIAQVKLDDRGVVAAMRFVDDVRPTKVHRGKHAGHADAERHGTP